MFIFYLSFTLRWKLHIFTIFSVGRSIVLYCVEEEFGKENQNGRSIIFDIKYEFHSEVGHNQKQ